MRTKSGGQKRKFIVVMEVMMLFQKKKKNYSFAKLLSVTSYGVALGVLSEMSLRKLSSVDFFRFVAMKMKMMMDWGIL